MSLVRQTLGNIKMVQINQRFWGDLQIWDSEERGPHREGGKQSAHRGKDTARPGKAGSQLRSLGPLMEQIGDYKYSYNRFFKYNGVVMGTFPALIIHSVQNLLNRDRGSDVQ